MARSTTAGVPRHAGVVALLAAGVLGVATLSLLPGPSSFQAPVTASVPASAPPPVAPRPAAVVAAPLPALGDPPPEPPPPAAAVEQPAPVALPQPESPAPAPLVDDVQQRVQEALGSLSYPWQELGWDIRFEPYTGGLLGLADPATRQITIFVKSRSTVQELRVVLAHEIAHALDDRYPEQRARYRALRGIPADTAWFPCGGCEDFASPAGDFAEVFAAWLVGATDFRSQVAPLPDDDQLRDLSPLFAPPSARMPAAAEPAPQRPRPSPSPSPRPLLQLGRGG